MFDNIGSKIKGVATVFTWLGIIASIIGGLSLMVAGGSSSFLLLGLVIMFGGSLLAWLTSLAFYGLGQLIENTDIIAELYTEEIANKKLNNSSFKPQYKSTNSVQAPNITSVVNVKAKTTEGNTLICPQCNYEQPNGRKVCWSCGVKFDTNNES